MIDFYRFVLGFGRKYTHTALRFCSKSVLMIQYAQNAEYLRSVDWLTGASVPTNTLVGVSLRC